MSNIALVTGGNGITGSAIIEELVRSTNKDQWSRIIVTSRSPFQTTVADPRIEFVALDFTVDAQTLAKSMKEACSGVTHAYFSSYVHRDDFAELNSANQALFETFLDALLQVAPKLKNCTLQTGGESIFERSEPSAMSWADSLRQVLQRAFASCTLAGSRDRCEAGESRAELLFPPRRLPGEAIGGPIVELECRSTRGHHWLHPETERHEFCAHMGAVLPGLQTPRRKCKDAHEPAVLEQHGRL